MIGDSLTLELNQTVRLFATPLDMGVPASIGDVPVWEALNPGYVTLDPNSSTFSCLITAIVEGTTGLKVTVIGQVANIQRTIQIKVVPALATEVVIIPGPILDTL